MNILIDLLPKSVEIEEQRYEISTDFRTSVLFELMMQDESISEAEKIRQALELYYPRIPENIDMAVRRLLWFYTCGKEKPHKEEKGRGISERVYSFEYDDDYIYSAFLFQYGIDLQDIKYLHWWKFRALFKALTEENEFVRIMGYRGMHVTDDMSKEQISFYRSMKELHRLPLPHDEEEKLDAITTALINGGDLSGIL